VARVFRPVAMEILHIVAISKLHGTGPLGLSNSVRGRREQSCVQNGPLGSYSIPPSRRRIVYIDENDNRRDSYLPDTRRHTAPCGTPRWQADRNINGSSRLKCGIYAEMSIRLLL